MKTKAEDPIKVLTKQRDNLMKQRARLDAKLSKVQEELTTLENERRRKRPRPYRCVWHPVPDGSKSGVYHRLKQLRDMLGVSTKRAHMFMQTRIALDMDEDTADVLRQSGFNLHELMHP